MIAFARARAGRLSRAATLVAYAVLLTAGARAQVRINTRPHLIGATAGSAYSYQLIAAGGTGPYTFAVAPGSGSPPPGVSVSSGGLISGTPASVEVATDYTFTVTATDTANNATAQTTFVLNVAPAPLQIANFPAAGAGVVGQVYSAYVLGGSPPTLVGGHFPQNFTPTFVIQSGIQPPGLRFDAKSLALMGTPTRAGTFTFTVLAMDYDFRTATASASVTVTAAQALAISSSTLPPATVGSPYSQALTASGGIVPYTWSWSGANLPPGLSLISDGKVEGTPTSSGSYTAQVQVTDGAGTSASAAISITVQSGGFIPLIGAGRRPTPRVRAGSRIAGPASVPDAPPSDPTISSPTSTPISYAVGIDIPVLATVTPSGAGTWDIVSGSLPPGLNLAINSYYGEIIDGTPFAAGAGKTYTPTLRFTSSADGSAATVALTMNVSAAQSNELPARTLPGMVDGAWYQFSASESPAVTDSNIPVQFSVTSGNLPPGTTLASSNAQTDVNAWAPVYGIPTTTGTYTFTVTATNASGSSSQATYTINVVPFFNPPQFNPPPGGFVATAGQPYDLNLSTLVTGGIPPYQFTLGGNLPSSFSINSAGHLVASPVPSQTGTYTFSLTGADDSGLEDDGPYRFSLESAALQIVPGGGSSPLAISSASPPPAEVNHAFSYQLTATGGPGGYTWSIQSAPAWLSISSSGLLSGTPSSAGSFSFTVMVTSPGVSASAPVTLTVYPALTITPVSLPAAPMNMPYSQQLNSSGGSGPPYVLSGSGLPPGLTLSAGGLISGTPTSTGTFSVTITDTDSAGFSTTFNYSIATSPAPLAIVTTSLPPAVIGAAYSQTLSASGGAGGYSWSATGLPSWLSLSAAGQLSGTPASTGSFNFTISVKDSAGNTAQSPFTLQVTGSLKITTQSLPGAVAGTPYSQPLAVTGALGAVTWSLAGGALPSGLTLSGSGVISGTPDTPGDSTFSVQAVDSTNLPVTAGLSLHVAPPATSTITTSLPSTLAPASQPNLGITLTPAYPLPLNFTATLTISPDLGGPTDLGFSNGSRTMPFTIPANTAQYSLPFATGTSAGTITITLTLLSTGQSIVVSGSLSQTGQISAQAPTIRSVTATASATGSTLTVVVTGFSTTRDMKTAQFHFTPAAGATLQTSDFTVDVSGAFSTWYTNPASFATGSQFSLTVPFTIGGSISTISSVTVTLTNSNSTSAAATATVQ